ncbi:MAG: hypothetical protein EAZ97_05120 [Bacteroidetes bacterium]|jgi:hypothetical protein|nr:MAG: hypothetical protein EAZ97_05120 [Bacteroidota bacterium]
MQAAVVSFRRLASNYQPCEREFFEYVRKEYETAFGVQGAYGEDMMLLSTSEVKPEELAEFKKAVRQELNKRIAEGKWTSTIVFDKDGERIDSKLKLRGANFGFELENNKYSFQIYYFSIEYTLLDVVPIHLPDGKESKNYILVVEGDKSEELKNGQKLENEAFHLVDNFHEVELYAYKRINFKFKL